MMTFIRNWPEGLFILLVMLAPIAVTTASQRTSLLGFFAALGSCMFVGFTTWLACVWAASKLCERIKSRDAG